MYIQYQATYLFFKLNLDYYHLDYYRAISRPCLNILYQVLYYSMHQSLVSNTIFEFMLWKLLSLKNLLSNIFPQDTNMIRAKIIVVTIIYKIYQSVIIDKSRTYRYKCPNDFDKVLKKII